MKSATVSTLSPRGRFNLPVVACQLLSCFPLFCDQTDCRPPGFSVHRIFQARTQVGCHFLLREIFLTQDSDQHFLQCRPIPLSHQGSPYMLFNFSYMLFTACQFGFPGSAVVRIQIQGWIPGSGISPGGGNGNSLHYSCLENCMDRGAWWPTIYSVAKSQL